MPKVRVLEKDAAIEAMQQMGVVPNKEITDKVLELSLTTLSGQDFYHGEQVVLEKFLSGEYVHGRQSRNVAEDVVGIISDENGRPASVLLKASVPVVNALQQHHLLHNAESVALKEQLVPVGARRAR